MLPGNPVRGLLTVPQIDPLTALDPPPDTLELIKQLNGDGGAGVEAVNVTAVEQDWSRPSPLQVWSPI